MKKIEELISTGTRITDEHPEVDLYATEMKLLFDKAAEDVKNDDSSPSKYKTNADYMADVAVRVMSYAYCVGVAKAAELKEV